MRALWLADVLRDAGLEVVELGGWESRGRDLDVAYGVICHDTVTTADWTDESVDRLLINGKRRTPGPLYQLGIDRQARFRIIASGRANHAGYSSPWGNSSIGIGVYCAGGLKDHEEPWSDRQYEAVTIGARAILDRLGLGRSAYFNPRVAGHKEIDTRGKIDPYQIDMSYLRRDVGQPTTEGQTVTLAQAVVVPAQEAHLWDRPLGAAVAQGYGLALVDSDEQGRLTHEGRPAEITDWAEVVGGGTRYPASSNAHRIAGEDRWATARAVFDFIREHNPSDWQRRGKPYGT